MSYWCFYMVGTSIDMNKALCNKGFFHFENNWESSLAITHKYQLDFRCIKSTNCATMFFINSVRKKFDEKKLLDVVCF